MSRNYADLWKQWAAAGNEGPLTLVYIVTMTEQGATSVIHGPIGHAQQKMVEAFCGPPLGELLQSVDSIDAISGVPGMAFLPASGSP